MAQHYDAISIHAPRTGSDATSGRTSRRRTEISIHAPRTGSDGKATDMTCPTLSFQSTLPARGATFCWSRSRLAGRHFNPRSPHGERPGAPRWNGGKKVFQSTLPARGATDTTFFGVCPTSFQSTLPARGATRSKPAGPVAGAISIHAPRTGSDDFAAFWFSATPPFQSTLPARGATKAP